MNFQNNAFSGEHTMSTSAVEDPPFETGIAVVQPAKPTSAILISITDATVTELLAESKKVDASSSYEIITKARMDLVRGRTSIEKQKLKLTEESRVYVKSVNDEAKRLTARLAGEEKRLTDIKETIDAEEARAAQEKADRIYEARVLRLADVGGALPESVIRALDEDNWEREMVFQIAAADDRKKEAERAAAAEAERLRIQAEQDEARRVESERLAAERAELERQRLEQQAKIDAANALIEADRQRQQAELDRQRAEQQKLIDAENARQEAVRQEQAEAQARIDAENRRLQAEAAARELAARQEANRIAEAARLEAETAERVRRQNEAAAARLNAEREAAARAEQLKPDVQKLKEFAAVVSKLDIPTLSDGICGHGAHAGVREVLIRAAGEIVGIANDLK